MKFSAIVRVEDKPKTVNDEQLNEVLALLNNLKDALAGLGVDLNKI